MVKGLVQWTGPHAYIRAGSDTTTGDPRCRGLRPLGTPEWIVACCAGAQKPYLRALIAPDLAQRVTLFKCAPEKTRKKGPTGLT